MVKIINGVEDKKTVIDLEYKDITLLELIRELEIDKLSIGAILVNGVPKKLTDRFLNDSEIYILPVLSGG